MSEENKLSGKPPSIVETNYLIYGCADPDMDIPNPKYMGAPEMQFFRDKVNMRRKGGGKIIITSNPCENGSMERIFNPCKVGFIPEI